MNILVLLKCVPDTEARIRIAADGKSIDESDIKFIISPFDEYAIEEALKQRDASGGGTVTVLSAGEERSQAVLRQALAMGADKAVLVTEPPAGGPDGLLAARVLAAAARVLGYDLVLAGKQGVGQDRSQVAVMVAELLDLPHVGVITELEIQDGKVRAVREIEGGKEIVESELPALLTCQKGLNEPRYASLKGIMAAKKKPLEIWGADKLDLGEASGEPSGETWVKLELPPPRHEARILKGEAPDVARELVKLLSEDAKVI